MRIHCLLLSTLTNVVAVAQHWTYIGNHLGIPVPLDSVLVENLTQEVYTVLDSSATLQVGVGEHSPTSSQGVFVLGVNPASDRSVFGVTAPTGGDIDAKVYDASGRRVASGNIVRSIPGIQVFQFQAGQPGIYFVHVTVNRVPQKVLRLLQTGSVGLSVLMHTGTMDTGSTKSGDRDLVFSWNYGDVVRHTAFATVCGAIAAHSLTDVPNDTMHYSFPLVQVPPTSTACMRAFPSNLSFTTPCTGDTTAPLPFLLAGEHLSCGSIAIGPVVGFLFGTDAAGPFTPDMTIAAPPSDSIWVVFAPQGAGPYAEGMNVHCGTVGVNVQLNGTVSNSPDPGTNGSLSICAGSAVTVQQLFAALGGTPDTGGIWSPEPDGLGEYTYTVYASAPCTDHLSAIVQVTEVQAPNAGENATLALCPSAGLTSLLDALGGTPDAGGTWTGPSGLSNGLFDPATMTAGTYIYTVSPSPCTPVAATVTITLTQDVCPNLTVTTAQPLDSLGEYCMGANMPIALTLVGDGLEPGAEIVVSGTPGLFFSQFIGPHLPTQTLHASASGEVPGSLLTLWVPLSTPGIFEGMVTITTAGMEPIELPVSVHVIDHTPAAAVVFQNEVLADTDPELFTMHLSSSVGAPCQPMPHGFQVVLQPLEEEPADTVFVDGTMDPSPQFTTAAACLPGRTYAIRAVVQYPTGEVSSGWTEYITRPGPFNGWSMNLHDTDILFNWNPITGAANHIMEIAMDPEFQELVPGYPWVIGSTPSHTFTGLTPNTLYYIRARAVNANGLIGPYASMMPQVQRTACPATMTDADGNGYPVTQIGGQCWTTENLRTTQYADGTPIPNIIATEEWSQLSTGAWCTYENAPWEWLYGRLYNWHAAVDPRGLCPQGWHVPTIGDYYTLLGGLGGDLVAGGAMKQTSPYWAQPNVEATNSSGFSGMPGGFKQVTGEFFHAGVNGDENGNWDGQTGAWWCTAPDDATGAWSLWLQANTGAAGWVVRHQGDGNSIRCILD